LVCLPSCFTVQDAITWEKKANLSRVSANEL